MKAVELVVEALTVSEEAKQKAKQLEPCARNYLYRQPLRSLFKRTSRLMAEFASQVCERAVADERARVAEHERKAREDFMRPLPPLEEILATHKKDSND